MPRHSNLIPLSHDHHEALLIALRLKKGGPTSEHDRLWPTALDGQVRSLLLFYERELVPHFRLEEEILFPIAIKIAELEELVKKLITQHQMMRDAIGIISQITDGDGLKKDLADFGLLLESHIRTEERELFPKLEETASKGKVTLPHLK